jgi:molybdopterin/thiamine biosynthesis adenylyltransferase
MEEEKVEWDREYASLVDRNLGMITREEQDRLKHSKVSIFGIGGLGGIVLEVLARSGVERFSIVDNDIIETSNLNRQNLAFLDTVGEMKIAAAERFCSKINPAIRLDAFDRVDEENCPEILAGSDVAALVLDDVKACLTISRTANRMGITFVEGWALPFANVCTFTPETPSFEQTYGLAEIQDIPVSMIPDEQNRLLLMRILAGFGYVEGVSDYFRDETLLKLARGRAPSFAPMVWFTATRIAVECVKVLLGWGDLALSPAFAVYDPFRNRVPQRLKEFPPDREALIRRILSASGGVFVR